MNILRWKTRPTVCFWLICSPIALFTGAPAASAQSPGTTAEGVVTELYELVTSNRIDSVHGGRVRAGFREFH
jgi:hypothetical protein